jgi:hypothetical protein
MKNGDHLVAVFNVGSKWFIRSVSFLWRMPHRN